MSSGVFPRFIKTLWQTCWAGVLVLLPATVTIYILWRLFTALEEVGRDVFGPFSREGYPGVSLLMLLLVILVTGMAASHFLGHRLVAWAESWVQGIPLVRSIYLTIKGMTDLFNFRSRFGQSTVVTFPFPRDGTWALGLVMGPAPPAVQHATGSQLQMLFVPTAIHPFTGYLAFVPTTAITPLALPVEEAMKIEFSAGLYRPHDPWLVSSATRRDEGR
ncbi:hypothetical protein YTPLAS18_02150 [Nitrospira sp.]|nr:hypothetical protein YTPLAS18_02150 [Nitrospira sp.]